MLEIGQSLKSRYRLKIQLGQNASRQTWLAVDLKSRPAKPVVVKLLAFGDQVEWNNLKLFEREARTLQQLNHPRIPRYRDYFSLDNGLLWFGLVQESIPGDSLQTRLTQKEVFSESTVREIASEILQILIYLHELSPPVLHRDIKPSNLILGEDRHVYLVDFGSVQDKAAKEGATFTVVGTYGYAPLEQFGGRATPASDLYALGSTLIHLLTGIAPADLPQQDARLRFAHLVTINPRLARWLEKLTAPNLSDRFQTARQALHALKTNESASSAPLTLRPPDSRIELIKSPERLKIKITPLWSKEALITRLLCVTVVFTVVLPLTVWVVWKLLFDPQGTRFVLGIALLMLFPILIGGSCWALPALGETTVCFDSQFFTVEWRLLRVRLQQQRGRIVDVDRVLYGESKKTPTWSERGVLLCTGVQEYFFGRLQSVTSQEECEWLVEEIKSWLGLDLNT